MKKRLLIIVLAALCLNLSNKAIAQAPTAPPANQAIDVTMKGIRVGEKVPNVVSLSKYKGKLIILDFWATWCSPCIAMIPKMEALQEQFKGQIQVIPVTYQAEQEVSLFLDKHTKGKPSALPQITADKELHKLFPHIYLPHYVWIDKEGTVKAITGMHEVTAANINKLLANQSPGDLEQKHDMEINHNHYKPFLINGNGGDGNNLIYHSILTGYSEGVRPLFSVIPQNGGGKKILYTNTTIVQLFKKAYTTYDDYYGANRTIIDVADSSAIVTQLRGAAVDDWLRKYGYCYELLLPPHLTSRAGEIMREEFDRLIPDFVAKLSKRKVRCYALVRTSKIDKLASKGGLVKSTFNGNGFELKGQKLNMLLLNLNAIYLQLSPFPLIDKTGYKGKVDLVIEAKLSNIPELNEALKAYDLKLEEQEAELDMLVISDRKKEQTK